MPGHIRGKDAKRVLKELGIKAPRKKMQSTIRDGRKQNRGKKDNWKPGPLDEAMADDLRKNFRIDLGEQ